MSSSRSESNSRQDPPSLNLNALTTYDDDDNDDNDHGDDIMIMMMMMMMVMKNFNDYIDNEC